MSTQVMVTLPDEVYRRVASLARLSGRRMSDVLADTIALSLPPLSPQADSAQPLSALPDEQVLALADTQMEPAQDQQLSRLLNQQQAGALTEAERSELFVLMQVYQERLLRRAQALHEAVRRGLRESLQP
jgi:hypothetical protein